VRLNSTSIDFGLLKYARSEPAGPLLFNQLIALSGSA
jgi:hypothetical protein